MQHQTRTLCLILVLSAAVSAQTFRGTILGTVTDPNGAVVSGATVTVKNTSTGLERTTTTDDSGNYSVPELPIGPYEVRVEQTGFGPSVVSSITVEVAKDAADLPINGRDFTKFLVMVPGATGDPSGATDSPGSFGLFSANGNRGSPKNPVTIFRQDCRI